VRGIRGETPHELDTRLQPPQQLVEGPGKHHDLVDGSTGELETVAQPARIVGADLGDETVERAEGPLGEAAAAERGEGNDHETNREQSQGESPVCRHE
jgi:hypothetical protein